MCASNCSAVRKKGCKLISTMKCVFIVIIRDIAVASIVGKLKETLENVMHDSIYMYM